MRWLAVVLVAGVGMVGCRLYGLSPIACVDDGDCTDDLRCVDGTCTAAEVEGEGPAEGEGEGAGEGEGEGEPPTAYAAAVLADDPVSFFRFEEQTGASAQNTVASSPAALWEGDKVLGVAGAMAGSLASRLNGETTRLVLGTGYGFAGNAPFSVELWVKPSLVDGSVRWILHQSDAAQTDGWDLYFAEGFLLWVRNADGTEFAYAAGNGPPALNAWTHLVGAYDGEWNWLYVNGELVGDGPGGPIGGGGQLVLGDRFEDQFFKYAGDIDELAIYGRALSDDEVAAHFSASFE